MHIKLSFSHAKNIWMFDGWIPWKNKEKLQKMTVWSSEKEKAKSKNMVANVINLPKDENQRLV